MGGSQGGLSRGLNFVNNLYSDDDSVGLSYVRKWTKLGISCMAGWLAMAIE